MDPLPPANVAGASDWLSPDQLESDDYEMLPDFTSVMEAARTAGVALSLQPLAFFQGSVWMLRIVPPGATETTAGYGLWSPYGLFSLDGTSAPIHDAIEREGLELTGDNVLAYTIWFCRHVHGDEGPFWVVLRREDLNTIDQASRDAVPDNLIRKPVVATSEPGWTVQVPVQYGGALFDAKFSVRPDGNINMDDDVPLFAAIEPNPQRNRRPLEWSVADATFEIPGHSSPAPRHPNQRAVRRSVGETLVRLQMLAALRRGEAAALFEAPGGDDEALLRGFVEFLVESAAFVVLESRTDYVERIVAGIVQDRVRNALPEKRALFMPHPEPGSRLPVVDDGDLVLISLHEGTRVERPQAVAFVLGSTDAATLVGCRNRSDLPEPLRQIADVVLSLEPLDADAFRTLFCEVFDCAWPAGVDLGTAEWLPYLEPADLQRALRDQAFRAAASHGGTAAAWRPEDAIAAVRLRVQERLARYLPQETRRLANLVGLGEARRVVEDLITDLAEALPGRLSWDDVDRGMLLVGPPGTGKTMLARVIARECGVRFVNARIGDWMTGDSSLGAVILAMQQTFADARQYAPCILFLDEIDSLGNRQHFGGRNESWDVALLTAVLEQLQGFETTRGVFVIGATNHEEQVDTALRRAGRLDRVVRLEYPMVTDLARILEQYLAPYRATGRVDADVDVAALGAVMAGSSGAQVAHHVRDAARRARRDGTPIATRHLLAAATGSPRRPIASLALTPAELERTAYHESGHAVAQLLARHLPFQLSVVSIVERGDGTLGFTGFVPGDTVGWTTAHYRDYLRLLLAGRAAEELRYGPAEVSTGAGGGSESCDLAIATAVATRMLCEANLHDRGIAAWRSKPATAEEVALLRGLLDRSYDDCRRLLRSQWRAVEALATRLLADRQVIGAEAAAIVRAHATPSAVREWPGREVAT
jgi:ATP-dependent Zn protease